MKHIIKILRPHQYIKNIFIFAPLLFSFQINLSTLLNTFIAFLLFSSIASSIYIFNDIMDREEDKKHPKKRFRPLANGDITLHTAILFFITLASTTLLMAFFFNKNLFFVLLLYFVLNIAYSTKLKHISIVDIFIIAIGFVLRLFAGTSVINSPLSMWIIIMTFLLALFLALAKRRDDVLLSIRGKETRKNIDGYNLEFINATMVLMSAVIIVSYILYTVSQEVITRLGTEYLYLTSIFVIFGIMRYMQITFVQEESGNPTHIILKDRILQSVIIFWLLSFFIIVKLKDSFY